MNTSTSSMVNEAARRRARQEAEKRSKLRRDMRRKLEENLHDEALKVDAERLQQRMEESNEFLKEIEGTQEGKLDALIFKNLAECQRAQAEGIDTNDRKFISTEFVAKLAEKMGATTEETVMQADAQSWVAWGKRVEPLFSRVPPLSYVFGSFETEETEKRKAPARRAAENRGFRNLQPATKITEQTSKNDEDQVEAIVRGIDRLLEEECRRSKNKRVGFFEFALDPQSFGKSVENMFHISFLVKQRKVLLAENPDTGMLELERLGGPGGGGNLDENDQVILAINKKEWRQLTEVLGIKRAKIGPGVSGPNGHRAGEEEDDDEGYAKRLKRYKKS